MSKIFTMLLHLLFFLRQISGYAKTKVVLKSCSKYYNYFIIISILSDSIIMVGEHCIYSIPFFFYFLFFNTSVHDIVYYVMNFNFLFLIISSHLSCMAFRFFLYLSFRPVFIVFSLMTLCKRNFSLISV